MEGTRKTLFPYGGFSIIREVFLFFLLCIPFVSLEKAIADEHFFLNRDPFDPITRSYKIGEKESAIESVAAPKSSLLSSWIIAFHQQVLSSTDGPRSHFYPTSSEYMKKALHIHGAIGFFLGMERLLRENGDPWIYPLIQIGSSLRKYDPVPNRTALRSFKKENEREKN